MSDEIRELWKRQEWDTPASYSAFAGYYLTQDPPRSVDQAYRLQKGYSQGTQKRATGCWRNWSQGKTANGQPISGAISWEKRANAWDDFQKQLAFEQETKLRLAKRRQRRALLDKGMYNIMKMVEKLDPDQFNPKALESPDLVKAAASLTSALKTISDQMRAEYDDQPTQNVQHSGQITTKTAPVVKVYLPDNGRNDRGN